jgi:hypothetical protein
MHSAPEAALDQLGCALSRQPAELDLYADTTDNAGLISHFRWSFEPQRLLLAYPGAEQEQQGEGSLSNPPPPCPRY